MDENLTVKEWMQAFYQEKMFADDAEHARWIFIRFGFLKIPFPNLKQRREAIWLHDLNHLLTGFRRFEKVWGNKISISFRLNVENSNR